ncbi:MAG: pyrimidine dimer glycosylase [Burkholderiaceae bacterium]|nr:pyrimidine dimer glycosylase [Burkholderiaceae bacterium]
MRLWSLHPQYLDAKGLVALWREALLAQAVIDGETRGYRHHPQLERFRQHPTPLAAIAQYLSAVQAEAKLRGYAFDQSKIRAAGGPACTIPVTTGQLDYEWQHLLQKLSVRSPAMHEKWHCTRTPTPHPLFQVQDGDVEPWERRQLPGN